MATYRFKCTTCNIEWDETLKTQVNPTSICKSCNSVCENIAFGGSGFQFSGRYLTDRLYGFPDHTRRTEKDAEEEANEFEKANDAMMGDTYKVQEQLKKEKQLAEEVSKKKREKRSSRFRENI